MKFFQWLEEGGRIGVLVLVLELLLVLLVGAKVQESSFGLSQASDEGIRSLEGFFWRQLQESHREDGRKHDIRLAIILGSFAAFIALLVCGPLCCICYGAKRIRDMRSKAAATHSLMFAEQWRSYNLFMPFNEEEEMGQHALAWSGWQFVYRGIPDELNGLSTAIFQSVPPVSGYISTTSGQTVQQIRLNPGCARMRRTQALQCLLPLSSSCHRPGNCLPNVNYFEMSILSFCRNGKSGRECGPISGKVAIGLAARPAPPFRLPGLDMVSLGYHSNGSVYMNDPHDGAAVSRRWNYVGTTVGCGYDLERCVVFFTLNGTQPIYTDFAYRADGGMPSTTPHLFPVVGADCDITVLVNLGQAEFQFGPANETRCMALLEEERRQSELLQLQERIRMSQQDHNEQPLVEVRAEQQDVVAQDEQVQAEQKSVAAARCEVKVDDRTSLDLTLDAAEQQQQSSVASVEDSEVYFSASDEPRAA